MHVNTAGAINTRDSDPAASGWRNPLNLLILGGILLIAAIAVGTVVTIVSFRQRALVNSERELQNTVLLLTRHFDREISDFENLQKDVIRRMRLTAIDTPEAFKGQLSGEDVHAALRTFVSGSVDASGVNVYDADGQLINSTLAWPVRAVNIADRDYFRELKSGSSPDTVVAPIRSRVTGAWITVFARKVVGSNGRFLGVITRGIPPANFESFFESLALGEGAAISVLHRDGTLVARYPHAEDMIGQNFSAAPVQQLLTKANHGTIRLISPIDGEDRLAAARALSQFPLSIIATTKTSSVLADWREQTRSLVIAAALAALAIAGTLFLIVRKLSKRHQESERRIALEKERLDTAVNNMTQGLLLYGSDARIVLRPTSP